MDIRAIPFHGDDLLVCGPNWLGDTIMAMPAVQALKRQSPSSSITLLVKENLAPLWRMNAQVDAIIPLGERFRGLCEAAKSVKAGCFDKAFVLPHSFRAALIPFLHKVPFRRGLGGNCRCALLNSRLRPAKNPERKHQVFEYFDVLGISPEPNLEMPDLVLQGDAIANVWHRLYLEGGLGHEGNGKSDLPLVGILPGAARGPSKAWPAERFGALGKMLARSGGCRILIFGSLGERRLCEQVREMIGGSTLNLAGETTLPELAAWLSLCRFAISNDSGGMHLAAAVGTPVAALFGTTDPAITGPIGPGHLLFQAKEAPRNRAVARNSAKSRAYLERIEPQEIYEAVMGRRMLV